MYETEEAMDLERTALEGEAYDAWTREHADELDAAAKAEWVASLCEDHESLRGDMMGATDYCDGTCVPAAERDDDAYLEHLEGLIPDYA